MCVYEEYVFMCMQVLRHVHVLSSKGSPWSHWSVSAVYPLKQRLSPPGPTPFNLVFPISCGLASQLTLETGVSVLSFQCWNYRAGCLPHPLGFSVDSGLHCSPHACTASFLPAESSPYLPLSIVFILLLFLC